MDESQRLKYDIGISKILLKIGKVCEKHGMEVETLFLQSIAMFFATGKPGLNAALLLFGNEMTELADSQHEVIKLLIKFETDIRREKNARNN